MPRDALKPEGEEARAEVRDPLEGKLLLTYQEVARALGLSRRTVFKLVAEGKLRRVHPTPRSARITRESLLAFLRSLEEERPEGTGKSVVDRAREVLRRFGL
ncbi:helix-turn-helix transcriptional regulator [Thermus sp. 93170]|uniref:helix-turn-helix transcriptional regulator n=1 Tax=Thermus sp. 93170 TaxID=1046939 RepID=UPI003F43CA58